ncbi:bifunctional nuclease family protein [Arachnia propionica]|jgi:hypothetical protein|uniref:Bifunctional nuclease family protein n=1 Tax=Arachnia propionica TaxID=1750 RepID=A0A3N4CW23_9ACTN|nr:bifunctional nuclease family protein [Arachnia propionica]QCT37847.1 bifunctional nuclease family protein [Arachnia propionica]QUC09798.1 bifunctional nuclease family protein [Arachnia propionica]QUC15524.1 bifunctional nuclease family protein [Arachnia propionica]RPA16724.1 bifunctional nuclease family protein [Arachnia propionica]VEH70216.1 Uncharacterised ACR, COG1259 [Arachnia propionica]
MVELCVVGIQVGDEGPVLLLRENDGERLLPVWISAVDAAAIAVALEQEQFARPLTQDLLAEAFAQLAGESQPQLTIRSMEDGVFYAEIVVDGVTFDARPSDVVAVAIRRGWPVHCPAELLDEVGISDEIAHVDEVEKFREFLDQVQPEDF